MQQDQVLLARLDPAQLDEASFLDQRVLTPQTQGGWFEFDAVENAATGLQKAPQGYIFHMGHCGSTLISRLIAASSGSIAIREPLPLRTLASDAAEGKGALLTSQGISRRLRLFEKLWARGDRQVIVKATSMCSDLIDQVSASARRVFLYQRPETHLAVLLAGPNALIDLRGFAQMRYRRLAQRFDLPPLSALGVGELAALTWLSEADAADRADTEPAIFDFDDFLAAPEDGLLSVSEALGVEISAEEAGQAINSPIMRTYSKAPEHHYDPSLRQEIISRAKTDHREEISAGAKWLEDIAKKHESASKLHARFG